MWKRAFKEFEGIWNFLKAVFHKFYLVHSLMLCPMPMFHFYGKLLWNGVIIGLNCSDLWFFRQSNKLPFWRFRLLSYYIVSAYFSSSNSCCQRSFFFGKKALLEVRGKLRTRLSIFLCFFLHFPGYPKLHKFL